MTSRPVERRPSRAGRAGMAAAAELSCQFGNVPSRLCPPADFDMIIFLFHKNYTNITIIDRGQYIDEIGVIISWISRLDTVVQRERGPNQSILALQPF